MILKLAMQHQRLMLYKVCINSDPGNVDLDLFNDKVKFGN